MSDGIMLRAVVSLKINARTVQIMEELLTCVEKPYSIFHLLYWVEFRSTGPSSSRAADS
jgi:hypothetical protein